MFEDDLTNDENDEDDHRDSNEMEIFKKHHSYESDVIDENYANYIEGKIYIYISHFFVGKIKSCNFKTFLNWVIVDWQELILYEYIACDGRGVRSKSAGWHKKRIILNKS